MSSMIIQTVDVLANVFIIFFLMKLLVNPREFYFNSALRPVDSATEPLLRKLRKFISPTKYGLDFTPLVAIVVLLGLRLCVYWGFTNLDIIPAIVISSQRIIQFMLSFLAFSVFVLLMVPVYTRNPLSSFLKTVIKPFERPFASISTNSKTPSLFGAMCLIILTVTLFYNLSACFLEANPVAALSNWHFWVSALIDMVIVSISVYKFIVLLLIAAVILSWVDAEVRNPIINLVYILTEPILLPVRRLVPPAGGLDLSPWIASILIGIIGKFLISLLLNLKHFVA